MGAHRGLARRRFAPDVAKGGTAVFQRHLVAVEGQRLGPPVGRHLVTLAVHHRAEAGRVFPGRGQHLRHLDPGFVQGLDQAEFDIVRHPVHGRPDQVEARAVVRAQLVQQFVIGAVGRVVRRDPGGLLKGAQDLVVQIARPGKDVDRARARALGKSRPRDPGRGQGQPGGCGGALQQAAAIQFVHASSPDWTAGRQPPDGMFRDRRQHIHGP